MEEPQLNTVDATCTICQQPIRWLSGTPRLCREHAPSNAADTTPVSDSAAAPQEPNASDRPGLVHGESRLNDTDERAYRDALTRSWEIEGDAARKRSLFAAGVRYAVQSLDDVNERTIERLREENYAERAKVEELQQTVEALGRVLHEHQRVRARHSILIVDSEDPSAQWYALTPIERRTE